MTFLARLSRDDNQGLTSYFNVEHRLPADDRPFEDIFLDTEGTGLPRCDKPRLVISLLEDVDRSRGHAEDDNLVGLMAKNVRVPLEFQIDGFSDTTTVLTTNERSKLAFFVSEFKVDNFMADGVRIYIFLRRAVVQLIN